jgi:hypothetical protein
VSLRGQAFKPLPARYGELKGRLLNGREDEIRASWERLLVHLREEIPIIEELGTKAIPEIQYEDINQPSEQFNRDLKKRGVAVVRGVVPERQALQWKEDIREYVRQNPHTKGESCTLLPVKPQPLLTKAKRFLRTTPRSLSCTGHRLN